MSFGYLGTRIQKAKKDHRCHYHGGIIPMFDMYEKYVGVYDGYFWETKICMACKAFMETPKAKDIREQIDDDGIDYHEPPLMNYDKYEEFLKTYKQ